MFTASKHISYLKISLAGKVQDLYIKTTENIAERN